MMCEMQLDIRPAAPIDAPLAAPLIQLSMGELASHLFASNESFTTQEVLKELFCFKQNRFSHQFSHIAEISGDFAGILQLYSAKMMKHVEIPMSRDLIKIYGLRGFLRFIRRSLSLHFIKEVEHDECFLNTVAVIPEEQGKGVGTALLGFAESLARQAKLRKCSLIVELGNIRARALYERWGYRIVQTTKTVRLGRLIGFKGVHRMVKVIE